eukprot:3052648-Amphidinium_carterae.2
MMADRLRWIPIDAGWRQGEQRLTWDEADYKSKWNSALQHCKEVSDSRPDFQGLASGLATQALRQLKLDGQSQKYSVKSALNAALGAKLGVWHEKPVPALSLMLAKYVFELATTLTLVREFFCPYQD